MTATNDPELHAALRNADMNLADGAPIAWLMRRRGWPEQQRLAGPDLMKKLLAETERHQLPVFLFGTSPDGLARLNTALQAAFPTLAIVGLHSPPFRDLSVEEDAAIIEQVRASGARLLLVGLGCPKQEKWMQRQRGKMPAVMIGLGAAFDYCSGSKQRAPIAWQRMGLEWLYRLGQEPRRLLIRYLLTNFLFLIHLPWELRKTQGRR
jgi:N-acetylglucosaminyldiphosphoundecaprenol N-acetyl-beta-D-mannosaminyltransferase